MKRYLVGLLAAGMVFALVMGSAAALNFGEVSPLQVGVTEKGALECDDSVDIQPGFAEGAIDPGEDPETRRDSWAVIVSDINVDGDGIPGSCEGAKLVALALDEEGHTLTSSVGEDGIADVIDSSEETLHWADRVDPLEIYGIELHISG